jgi:hypothetical protein
MWRSPKNKKTREKAGRRGEKMKAWVGFLVVASCAASAVAGWFSHASLASDRPQLVATPRVIERCEKYVADAVLDGVNDSIPEKAAKVHATLVEECYDYGLVSDRYMNTIRNGSIGPYLTASGAS